MLKEKSKFSYQNDYWSTSGKYLKNWLSYLLWQKVNLGSQYEIRVVVVFFSVVVSVLFLFSRISTCVHKLLMKTDYANTGVQL